MPLPPKPRAVVTGAGSGLGRAFCVELARRGARILVSDIDLGRATETAALLAGADAHAAACDVARFDDVRLLAERADDVLGGVDLLINNAGVAVAGPLDSVSLDDWRWIIDINLWGVIHGVRAFVPKLRARNAGHVINVASAAGFVPMPSLGPYATTKAGVIALSETLYAELAGTNVGVTVLCPTFFQSNIALSLRADDPTRRLAQALMDAANLSAADVARYALEAASRGELYAVPQSDARWLWRAKRLAPDRFHHAVPRLSRARMRRLRKE